MRVGVVLFALLAGVACEKKVEAPAAAPAPQAQAQGQAQATAKGAVPPAAERKNSTLKGKVVETMNAKGYTYLRVKTDSAEVWAAVAQRQLAVGDEVVVTGFPMKNFTSAGLKRTFEEIYFGSLTAPGAPAAAGSAAVQPNPHGGSATGAPGSQTTGSPTAPAAKTGPANVKRADGPSGRTVAEIFAERAKLDGQPVTVRGLVSKVTRQVMGRTWVHLRDDTGSAADKTDDLTVTTAEDAQVGDVVLAQGTVKTKQQFGAGYSYEVLVEGARLTKEARPQ